MISHYFETNIAKELSYMKNLCVLLLLGAALLTLPGSLAIRFKVSDDHSSCLLFFVDSHKDSPEVYVKYFTNYSNVEEVRVIASSLSIKVMDPHHSEKAAYVINPKEPKGTLLWFPVKIDPTDTSSRLGGALVGEYALCFSVIKTTHFGLLEPLLKYERREVELSEGDPHTKSRLQKAAQEKGHPIAVSPQKKGDGPVCTRESVEEKNELLGELHAELEKVLEATNVLTKRNKRFRVTSDSTFTRVWVLGVLTILVFTGTSFFMYRSLASILIKKKLV